MSKKSIFAEGNDIKLIEDLTKHLGKDQSTILYRKTDGWTNLPKVKSLFLENTDKGGTNLVIFDADTNCTNRQQEIQQIRTTLGISFELFLMPDNVLNGCCENLLTSIINQNFNALLHCFDSYSNCINNLNYAYEETNQKDKFFAFTSATGQRNSLSEIDFLDATYYDLKQPSIQPLLSFLDHHL